MKKLIQIIGLCCLCVGFVSCNDEGPSGSTFTLTTNKYVQYEATQAYVTASCATTGEMSAYGIDRCGFCYSESSMPNNSQKVVSVNLENYPIDNDKSSYQYATNLTNLKPGTTYYVRAFVQNSYGVAYGNEISFTTQGTLEVQTVKVEEAEHGMLSVTINVQPNADVKKYDCGYCYSTTNQLPTLQESEGSSTTIGKTAYGKETSGWGIEPNTTYYVRAFAKVGDVISYGDVLSITTKKRPEVNILSLQGSGNTAQVFCGITNTDNVVIEESGICYGLTSDIKYENATCVKAVSFDTNFYACTLSNLALGKTYYVRAYLKIRDGYVIYAPVQAYTPSN